jgi:hypothetical protein
MIRTFVRPLLAVAMFAGAGLACEIGLAQDCPNCPGGHRHGHAHGFGIRGAQPLGDYPVAFSRAAYDENHWEYAGHGGPGTCPGGNCQYRYYGQPNLFGNYYTWNNCGATPAALYVSPRPIPPHVGHTFITYQPLYPHEFMYTHHRTYHRYYNGGQGLNRTSVRYSHSPFGERHFWH